MLLQQLSFVRLELVLCSIKKMLKWSTNSLSWFLVKRLFLFWHNKELYTLSLELGLKSVVMKQCQTPGPHWVQTQNPGLISIMQWSTWAPIKTRGRGRWPDKTAGIMSVFCIAMSQLPVQCLEHRRYLIHIYMEWMKCFSKVSRAYIPPIFPAPFPSPKSHFLKVSILQDFVCWEMNLEGKELSYDWVRKCLSIWESLLMSWNKGQICYRNE